MAVEKNTPFIYSIPLWLPADYNHWLSFCLNSFFALFLYSFFSIHHASHKKKIITISIKINQLTFYVYVRRLWNGASLSDPNVTVPNCMYMWCLILICYNIYMCVSIDMWAWWPTWPHPSHLQKDCSIPFFVHTTHCSLFIAR